MTKVVLITAMFLWSAALCQKEPLFINLSKSVTTIGTNLYQNILVDSITHPMGEYYPEQNIHTSVTMNNPSRSEKERTIEFLLTDRDGKVIDTVKKTDTITAKSKKEVAFDYSLPKDISSGRYYTEIHVWDTTINPSGVTDINQRPLQSEPVLIKKDKAKEGFLVYQQKEEFDTIDPQVWVISDKKLGRSKLQPENVTTKEGSLLITLPKNTTDGGELCTKELQSFGIYEARMKVPDTPSSLTGFFFYLEPDYYYEIDIEVFNHTQGSLYLTTYVDGKKSKDYVGKLDFDPTKEYHDYRMEYYPDSLTYYVDDIKLIQWKNGFPLKPMKLYINCWFPTWLEGIRPAEDIALSVEWIKY